MSNKVVSIDGITVAAEGQPNPDVVRRLEGLLAEAKQGHIQSIFGGYETQTGGGHFCTGAGDCATAIGLLEMAKNELIVYAREE